MPIRNLTDADLEALSDMLIAKMEKKFYLNLGKGVWKYAWSAIVVALIALSAYGAYHNK